MHAEYGDDCAVMFFDEGRFGLKPILGRAWFPKGVRPIQVIHPRYLNFYLYSAVNPLTGEEFTLFIPWVNTEMMNLYLQQLRLGIKKRKILLVMDRAGWHCSKDLVLPEGIEIVHLPPYSPELNPVEKLWWWLRLYVCRNRLYTELEEIEDELGNAWLRLTTEVLKSLCGCKYL